MKLADHIVRLGQRRDTHKALVG